MRQSSGASIMPTSLCHCYQKVGFPGAAKSVAGERRIEIRRSNFRCAKKPHGHERPSRQWRIPRRRAGRFRVLLNGETKADDKV
jgi:hypothetical protein